MAAPMKITLVVDFQSANAAQNINQLNAAIGQIGPKASQSSGQATASVDKTAQSVKGLSVTVEQASNSMLSFGQAMAGLGLAQVSRELLTIGIEMQRLRMGFENLPGGTAAWKELHDFAMLVGADFRAMVNNANELQKAGMKINDVTRALKAFQDLAVRTGASQEQLNEAVNGLARITAGGYVNFRALQQFRVLGLEPGIALAKALGISVQELRHQIGDFDAKEFADYIVSLAEATSAGEALRRSNELTTTGFNRLKTQFADTAEILVKVLNPEIQKLAGYLKDVARWAQEHPDFINKAFEFAKWTIALTAANKLLGIAGGLITGIGEAAAKAAPAVSTFLLALTPSQTTILIAAAIASFVAFQKIIYDTTKKFDFEEQELERQTYETSQDIVKRYFKTVEQLRLEQKKATGKEPGIDTFTPFGVPTEEVIARVAEMQKLIEKFRTLRVPPPRPDDPEAMNRILEQSVKAVDESVAHMKKANKEVIDALVQTFIEEQRKVDEVHATTTATIAKREKALANFRIALWNNARAEITKAVEEANKEADKIMLESARVQRQVAIAQAEAIPDETYAGRKRVADAKERAFSEELTEELRIKAKAVDDQLKLDKQGLLAAAAFALITDKEYDKEAQRRNEAASLVKMALSDEYTKKQQKHTLDSVKITNELQIALEKELRERVLAEDLAAIQQRTELFTQYVESQRQETFRGRVGALQTASDIEAQGIADTANRQIAAHNATLAEFVRRNSEYAASVKQMTDKTAHENYMIRIQAETDLQKNRQDLWRKTDEAIVEEEMRIFGNLKDFFSGFYDALLDRSKSTFAAIGDFLKKSISNALRDIVSSRLAGAVMPAFGFPSPTFPEAGRPAQPFFRALTPAPVPLLTTQAGGPTQIESKLVTAVDGLGTGVIYLNNSALNLNAATGNLNIATAYLIQGARISAAAASGAPTVSRFGSANREAEDIGAASPVPPTLAPMPFPGGGAGGGGAFGLPFPSASAPRPPTLPSILGLGGIPSLGAAGVTLPGFTPGMRGSLGLGGPQVGGIGGSLTSFGVGQPVTRLLGNSMVQRTGTLTTVPWALATPAEKLHSVLTSPGFASLLAAGGTTLALGGLQRGGVSGNVQTTAGGILAGIGVARMFPALQMTYLGGALIGGGIGLAAAGLQRGGVSGLAMSIGGAALAGGAIGSIVPGIGTVVGAAIGAGVGAIAGLIRLAHPDMDVRIRNEIKRVYGVDIRERSVRNTIAEIVKSKYGGNLFLAVYSQDVMDIVRLYARASGQVPAGLPREMLPATFAQSQAGGLQLQPVYSGGQLVQNPYTGTTTAQLQNAVLTNSPPLFLQLNPQQATDLLNGKIVQAIGNNPESVAQANTVANVRGASRTSQAQSLLEPLTVMR